MERYDERGRKIGEQKLGQGFRIRSYQRIGGVNGGIFKNSVRPNAFVSICTRIKPDGTVETAIHRRNIEKDRARERNRRHERKADVLRFLGERCACPGECAESLFEFMTVDHIGGNGTRDRSSDGWFSQFYFRLLQDKDAKSKYRTLCMNCNFAIGKYGYCPHERRKLN